ncbi:Arsenate reductase [Roseovarius albus]|uniref:Arsenate reductase n=1 Tax=Roseovarius albus TaxID=1247867 RepID=A0A1X6ZG31_9RHOB|nr:arsenate reductase (glutaredoxin) [Roseovarius albus]SLN50483.1 Arsenate reductase [Roseovarius albus]
MSIVIHHNPGCGTSTNVLDIIRQAGYDPVVVEYLNTGWTKEQLQGLFAAADLTPRGALRTYKTNAEELGLTDPSVSDEALLDAMVENPVLVNRPIVCSNKGVALCRPSEKILDLLQNWPAGPVYKKDGEMILDEDGNRV